MKNAKSIVFVLLGAVLAVSIVNFALLAYSTGVLDSRIFELKEAKRPANIELTILSVASSCKECASIEDYVSALKGLSVNVTKETTVNIGSSQASSFPNVSRLPAIIVSGETEKISKAFSSLGFSSVGNYLVFETPYAPYYDYKASAVRGLVKAIAIGEPSCQFCTSPEALVGNLELSGMYFSEKTILSASSPEAEDLISGHRISALPALVLSPDASEYRSIISQAGARVSGESYIIEATKPVYYSYSEKRAVGIVNITFLNDSSCTTCADPLYNIIVLARFGVVPYGRTTLDVSSEEGKAIVSNYNITKVPAFVLTGEPELYPGLVSVWPSVGSVETDGTFVFRDPSVMGTYKDLSTGQVVEIQE